MSYPNPNYVDGLEAVVALSVYCYNNGVTYMTYDGDPGQASAQTDLMNSDKQLIGSVTYAGGARKGTLNLQYNLATDETPGSANEVKNGYVVSFRGRYYVVDQVKPKIVKNDVIKFSCQATELANPFCANLLSTLGQQLAISHAASGGFTQTAVGSNTRTGAAVAYTLETFGTPGSAAPAGFGINASTGLITYTPTIATGTYDLRAIVTDTVTLADGTTDVIKGWGRYTVVLT